MRLRCFDWTISMLRVSVWKMSRHSKVIISHVQLVAFPVRTDEPSSPSRRPHERESYSPTETFTYWDHSRTSRLLATQSVILLWALLQTRCMPGFGRSLPAWGSGSESTTTTFLFHKVYSNRNSFSETSRERIDHHHVFEGVAVGSLVGELETQLERVFSVFGVVQLDLLCDLASGAQHEARRLTHHHFDVRWDRGQKGQFGERLREHRGDVGGEQSEVRLLRLGMNQLELDAHAVLLVGQHGGRSAGQCGAHGRHRRSGRGTGCEHSTEAAGSTAQRGGRQGDDRGAGDRGDRRRGVHRCERRTGSTAHGRQRRRTETEAGQQVGGRRETARRRLGGGGGSERRAGRARNTAGEQREEVIASARGRCHRCDTDALSGASSGLSGRACYRSRGAATVAATSGRVLLGVHRRRLSLALLHRGHLGEHGVTDALLGSLAQEHVVLAGTVLQLQCHASGVRVDDAVAALGDRRLTRGQLGQRSQCQFLRLRGGRRMDQHLLEQLQEILWSARRVGVTGRRKVSILAQSPHTHLNQGLLEEVTLQRDIQLLDGVRMQLGSLTDEGDKTSNHFVGYVVAGDGHDAQDGVKVILSRGSELVGDQADLGGEVGTELGGGGQQEGQHLAHQHADVLLVDQRVDEVESATLDRDVRVLQAVYDGAAVALHGAQIHADHLVQRVQGHVAQVVVALAQEGAQNVDGQLAQFGLGTDREDGLHTLVLDGVADVARVLGVGGHLSQDVVHLVAGRLVVATQIAQRTQHFHLQERIRDAEHIVLGRVARQGQALQNADQYRDQRTKIFARFTLASLKNLHHESGSREEHTMMTIDNKSLDLVHKLTHDLRSLTHDAHRTECSLLANVRIGTLEELDDIRSYITRDLRRGNVTQSTQRQSNHVLVRMIQILFDGVCGQGEDLLALVEKQHETQITNTFVTVVL
mmetsp:Transcript_17683/g.45047  ORF Transcript_17683/g.45047 Transcript_17683/m.45047 type:complete len:928 (-) Transcript_17683:351-3134(-)